MVIAVYVCVYVCVLALSIRWYCPVLVHLLSQSRKKLRSQVWRGLQASPKFSPVGKIMWKLLRQIIPASTAAGSEILGSAPDSMLMVMQPQACGTVCLHNPLRPLALEAKVHLVA